MTTKTMHIGLKQREVVLPNVEALDFETYKKSIRMHEAGEKYTPKRQQNLTQAQRTAKADVMRRTALSTNAKIKADARAYRETHGISEQHDDGVGRIHTHALPHRFILLAEHNNRPIIMPYAKIQAL